MIRNGTKTQTRRLFRFSCMGNEIEKVEKVRECHI